jgi:hypothetical protein
MEYDDTFKATALLGVPLETRHEYIIIDDLVINPSTGRIDSVLVGIFRLGDNRPFNDISGDPDLFVYNTGRHESVLCVAPLGLPS